MLALPGIRVGRAGLERHPRSVLRGQAGAVQLEVNAVGRVIRELDRQEGTPGAGRRHSRIDFELQQAVLKRLGDESASAVVMDCRNGEVIAMATNPSFDPSLFNSGVSQAQWVEWTSNRRAPLINKAAAGLYAPGSTFKMVVALSGLEAKAISPYDRINCPGFIDVGDTRFHCWRKERPRRRSTCMAGSRTAATSISTRSRGAPASDRMAAMANRFGLGVDLDIELPGSAPGAGPDARLADGPWQGMEHRRYDRAWYRPGLHRRSRRWPLATMAARIATGRAVQPHLTRTIGGVMQRGVRAEDWPSLGLPEKELTIVRDGMFAVVNEPGGTAPFARLPPEAHAQLAGKTGSSQVRRVSREQREHGFKSETLPWEFRPHALFVAFAPYDAPRYARVGGRRARQCRRGGGGAAGARHHGRRAGAGPRGATPIRPAGAKVAESGRT